MPLRIRIAELEEEDADYGAETGKKRKGNKKKMRSQEEPEWGPVCPATSASLTPLMHAAREGHTEAVRLLIEASARLSDVDNEGMQVIHFAAIAGSHECCSLL